MNPSNPYRGRIAPSPTGYLHIGHARTFWIAQRRALENRGVLVYRDEDLDFQRCKPEFSQAAIEDLHWLGIQWQEPIIRQSERVEIYQSYFEKLKMKGLIYPCTCSRKEISLAAAAAPHAGDEEPLYPGTCRHRKEGELAPGQKVVWRFRVPDGTPISFKDGFFGEQTYTAGRDFGDFIVWRHDHLPAYQLAVVVDDALMGITEVVRGEDLLLSTARQLLLYQALGWQPPCFYHCPLVRDAQGVRLAKRSDALSLRTLRSQGMTPETLLNL